MDNEKFQELMLDHFAKLFKEFQEVKGELTGGLAEVKNDLTGLTNNVREIKDSQIRMENKFDDQITALHDFRVGQEQINQEIKDALATLGTKVEEMQLEARATDEKLDNVSDDINYLARRSLRQEKQLKGLKGV